MAYEKRIRHAGLNAFRVIRGTDFEVVELKAAMQLKAWDEKWAKLERARQEQEKKRAALYNKQQKRELADIQTREAQGQLDALEGILTRSLKIDHRLDWEKLKEKAAFPLPRPQRPAPEPIPRQPIRSDLTYQPQLGLLDKLIPSRRERKMVEAEKRFQADQTSWLQSKAMVIKQNEERERIFESELTIWEKQRADFEAEKAKKNEALERRRTDYFAKEPIEIVAYCDAVLSEPDYPDSFPRSCVLDYLTETRTVIVEYALPAICSLPRLKEIKYIATKDAFQNVYVSDEWLRRTYDNLLYQIALRAVFELFQSDAAGAVAAVAFNGWVTSVDKSTGQEVTACILSLHAQKEEFMQINLEQVDPKACFKKLKGVSGSKLSELTPVRPILQISRHDKRFVASYAVAESLDQSTNLAAMDWEDFENLIRELFEKEFSKNGGEVKITRASRDGGVDAIAFDPDPIRGGKIAIQAKRYTNTVSVSAVRDLYGTVLNEGANKGILVTTADYGQDAFEFAKGKPLTLISGSELLYLLQQHGYHARIDLAEARKLLSEQERSKQSSAPKTPEA